MEEIVFPNQIRINRKVSGVSMQELANKLGVSLSAISKIEKGYRRLNQEQLIVVAETLNCSLQDLYVSEQNSDSEVVQAWKREQERRQEINKKSGLKVLGAGLRYLRNEKSLSLIEIAEKSSMTLSVYHRIEMGQREISDIERKNIAKALDLNADLLQKSITALSEKGLLDEIITTNETKYKNNYLNNFFKNGQSSDDEDTKIAVFGTPNANGSIFIDTALKEITSPCDLKESRGLFGVNLCSRRLGGLLSNRSILIVSPNEVPGIGDLAVYYINETQVFVVSLREDDNGVLYGKLWNPEEKITFEADAKLCKVVNIIL